LIAPTKKIQKKNPVGLKTKENKCRVVCRPKKKRAGAATIKLLKNNGNIERVIVFFFFFFVVFLGHVDGCNLQRGALFSIRGLLRWWGGQPVTGCEHTEVSAGSHDEVKNSRCLFLVFHTIERAVIICTQNPTTENTTPPPKSFPQPPSFSFHIHKRFPSFSTYFSFFFFFFKNQIEFFSFARSIFLSLIEFLCISNHRNARKWETIEVKRELLGGGVNVSIKGSTFGRETRSKVQQQQQPHKKNAIAKTAADFFLILEKIRFNSTHNWKCCECLVQH
jgi:hypothetical protein